MLVALYAGPCPFPFEEPRGEDADVEEEAITKLIERGWASVFNNKAILTLPGIEAYGKLPVCFQRG
jgi:hypothetical protein